MSAPPATSLPTPLDPFVGRHNELAALRGTVKTSRLVSVVGAPGAGKTRLVLHASASPELAEAFPDGRWFVALAAVGDPTAAVPSALAAAASVPEAAGWSITDSLAAFFDDRRVLVVLDNCEHVLDGVAALVAELLAACPKLVVIATSQQTLGVAGEHPVAIGPLAVPGPTAELKELVAAESVQLFCARAAAVAADFALNESNAEAVAALCRRLDGLPLAIELAAAMTAVLAPAEIAARLQDRRALLHRSKPAEDARHQSLTSALEWSHGLLSTPEQVLLRRLGVFSGGATLDAVEAVCSGTDTEAHEVLGALAALVRKSLVVAETATVPTRYRLLETIRQFALERVGQAGEEDQLRHGHAAWCLAFAEEAEAHFTAADQLVWFERTDAEVDNLRSALAWFADHNDSVAGLRLAGALVVYWRVRCAFSEGVQWLERFLATSVRRRRAIVPAVRAKALWGWGFLTAMLGGSNAAAPALEEAAALFEAAGDSAGQARALLILGNCHLYEDADKALEALHRAEQLAEVAGDTWCLSHALALAAVAHVRLAQMGKARSSLDAGIAVARAAGEPQGLRIGLALLGDLAAGVGDYALAERTIKESLALLRPLGEAYGIAVALRILGDVAAQRGEFEEARALLSEGQELARRSANPLVLVGVMCALGRLGLAEDRLEEAERWFRAGDSYEPLGAVGAALGLGDVAAAGGELDTAGSHYRAALRAARRVGERREETAALHGLGLVAAARGAHTRAIAYQRQAVLASAEVDDGVGIARSLAALASLAMAAGRARQVARLFGAASALYDSTGAVRTPSEARRQQPDMERATQDLGPEAFAEAWNEGAALSVEGAVGFATRGGARRRGAESGWEALTPAQKEIATLVAAGLSNAQIGQRQLVSSRTVASHLRHIFAKLDISSRTELAALAGRHQGQGRQNVEH